MVAVEVVETVDIAVEGRVVPVLLGLLVVET